MALKSYKNGAKFEHELCQWFSSQGYYVIYNERNASGAQPVDSIIIKNNIATMVEIKNLDNKTGRFDLNRIEFNQLSSYKRFRECNNTNFIVAIKWSDSVYFLDFSILQFYNKSVPLSKIQPSIENWSNVIEDLEV